jgi:hypothetical protein
MVIKVEPDSDSEPGPLSPQVTTELIEPDEEQGASQFIFVPVQAQIKVGCSLVLCDIRWNSMVQRCTNPYTVTNQDILYSEK